MDLSADDPRVAIATWLQIQAAYCEQLGSPMYASLLERAARDATEGGPVYEVLHGHEHDPPGSALALRFMGAMHRLVLSGRAPELAVHYPSAGGGSEAGDAWPAFRAAVATHADELRSLVERPVQTNEVGRSASLLGGFLMVARETGMPLGLHEVGPSAGLNLRWDQYRYESGAWKWGPDSSRVRFTDVFDGPTPEAVPATVTARLGCDVNPLDATTLEGTLTLMAYTWPDQTRRFDQLRGALHIARRVPVYVQRADAHAWLAEKFASATPGIARVVFHSIVLQYLSEEGRARLRATLEEAGSRARADSPLAWLRLEPSNPDGGGRFLVHLTIWPGGEERLLAESHPHGPPVHWLGDRE